MRLTLAVTAVLLLLLLLVIAPAGRAADIRTGETLASALEKYRTEGARIVYATGLVRNHNRVAAVPDPALPIEVQLRTLLAPFGLTVTPGADDLWVVVALTEAPAEPEPPPEPEDVNQRVIEEVVVTAPHHRILRSPAPAQSLTSREFDQIPAAGRDVFRAVTALPGQASDGVSARQKIRGGSENEVLYLLDGTQLIAPFHMDGFFSPFSALNTNVLEAVEVYNAGYPARYGTRSGGVLDLTLTRSDKPFSGSVDLNLLRASAHAKGAAEDWQWLVSARRGTLDYVLRQLNNDYGEPAFHDQMVRVARETDRSLFALGILNSVDEILLKNPSINEQGRSDRHNVNAWAALDTLIGHRARLAGQLSYNRISNERDGSLDNPVDAVGSVQTAEKVEIYRFSAEMGYALTNRISSSVGFEYQAHQGSFAGYLQSVYGPLGAPVQPAPGLERRFDLTRKGAMAAVYASLAARLTDRLDMELGVRWDYQDIDPVHDGRLSPRLQMNFDPTDRLSLFLNAGRYVQHQYLFEVPLDDGLIELAPPQRLDQISVGARLQIGADFELLVEAYGKRIRDPQPRADNLYNRYVLLPEIHSDRVLLAPDRARASGLEISLAGKLSRRLGWRMGYVYSDVSERIGGSWRPRPWDQHHAMRAQLDWEGERWQAGLHVIYRDGWATTDLITSPGVGTSAYNDTRLRDFVSVDASIARVWQFQQSSLELYLQVSNLFDQTNVGGYDYRLDEGGEWEGEPRELLPVLPVLGLKFSW